MNAEAAIAVKEGQTDSHARQLSSKFHGKAKRHSRKINKLKGHADTCETVISLNMSEAP